MPKKSFFDHPYYRLNKIYLSRLGIWPEQSFFVRCFMPLLYWAILMSVVIPEVLQTCDVLKIDDNLSVCRAHDIDTLLDCIPPLLVITVSFMQLFNGSLNCKTIHAMLNRISSDWQHLGQSPNIEILHKYAAKGRFITRTYINAMYFGIVFYLATPFFPVMMNFIVPLNESRDKNYPFEAEYGVNPDDYYWLILCHFYVTATVSIVIIIWIDVMFFAMVEHSCALFEIVGINLKMIKKTIVGIESVDDAAYRMICHCIDLHREAITFAGLIEDSYSASFVVVIGLSLIILSITGVQTVMHIDEPQEMLRYASFTIAQIFHLYFNSVPGQKCLDYSLSIFDHAYADGWDGLSIKAKKLLLMIMRRSLKPCQLSAGKIYVLSMENYSSVMQTSMSYFTVLSSMR